MTNAKTLVVVVVLINWAFGAVPDKADCKLPKEPGLCRAAFPMFYFDSVSKSCKTFSYGGCGGNKNRFGSKEECQKACES